MEDYGFSSGLISRLFRKILPIVPEAHTIEYILLKEEDPVPYALNLLDFGTLSNGVISNQLDLSIKALCSKVIAFGLDSNIKGKYSFLQLNSKPFETLLEKVNHLTQCKREEIEGITASLKAIESLITDLRKNKNKIGTNFHLTITTRRILEYTRRIKELLHLKQNIESKEAWEHLFLKYIAYAEHKNSIRRYIDRHSDLVALEIIEHTSNKGEKYIAEGRKGYWNFFYRSLLGGGLISVFALFKIMIDSYQLPQLNNAYWYSINYALCFVLVKKVGGIIATKQPAMTASTIAKNIDKQDDLKIDSIQSITILVKKVFRSQFVSILGNFIMALMLAGIIMYSLRAFGAENFTRAVDSEYLIQNAVPSFGLLFFSAVAGLFLALSGLVSGYFDNKAVASNFAYRIQNSSLFFNSKRLARYVEKKAGAILGNISLGFFLGSAFLLSNLLPFSIDIRHIAFSSANVGYAVMNQDFNMSMILLALSGALLIGLVNLIVSFSITLYLALKSRGASFRLVPKILTNLFRSPSQ
ncbi:hypothetical protein POV27_00825 [Aureisphaera galaxeae]|uniref:hypothetical protein n=1 Tax=Aureisphaera galaxeae TaxID=1538023 RepID=UPI0023505C43|nr:hypothetical protein [Aureisphaera galaxeae]MDC8002580.1 hypothetical protein [Aureisphaera galaxeae]